MTTELLSPGDILGKEEYEKQRPDFRRKIMQEKSRRRVLVGDHCSVHFESRETMRYQVQEMLRAEDSWERDGAVEDELEAYNPLIPRRGELSATVMFEYETPEERAEILPKLVGIEHHLWLHVGDAEPLLAELDRGQIDETKVSSIQYAKWKLTDEHRELLRRDGTVVRIVIDHPSYQAQAVLSEDSRKAIRDDPD